MIELGLQRISRLLADTPFPWRAIHVAGTNGKGSVCAYISGMLEAYNASAWRQRSQRPRIRHARFTSPHLIDRWDCITVEQQAVSFKVFDDVERRVLARNERLGIKASEFELLTATAFEIFTQENVEIGVVEVGMGGRLDATNVIGSAVERAGGDGRQVDVEVARPTPLMCALTKIGLDHQAFLGDTLEAIAAEKAGIIKADSAVAWDQSNPESVCQVFEQCAMEVGADVWDISDFEGIPVVDEEFLRRNLPEWGTSLAASGPADRRSRGKLRSAAGTEKELPLHTKQNAILAFTATWSALLQLDRVPENCDRLKPDENMSELFQLLADMLHVPHGTRHGGRLQRVSIDKIVGRPQSILLDGAHNAQSAAVLAEEVKLLREQHQGSGGTGSVTWILATSSSKPPSEILRPLLRSGDTLYAVEFGSVDGMPWVKATKAPDLVEAAHAVVRENNGSLAVATESGTDLARAFDEAAASAEGEPLVVAGSLYLVSEVLKLLRDTEQKQT